MTCAAGGSRVFVGAAGPVSGDDLRRDLPRYLGSANLHAARLHHHGPRRTGRKAGVAAGTPFVPYLMFAIRRERYRTDGALLGAQRAADASVGDPVVDERDALAGRAPALQMGLVFLPEITQRGQHGVGRGLAQPADAAGADGVGEILQRREVVRPAAALADAIQDIQHAAGAHAAQRAFAARLVLSEAEEIAGDIDHAVGIVQNHQTARPHDGARRREGLVVHRRIEERDGDASAGRPADLDGLEVATGQGPAADLLDDLTEGHPHGHLDQPAALHLAGQGEDLGSLAAGRAEGREAFGAVAENPRDEGQGLDVVDQGGPAVQARLSRIRRSQARHAAATLDGGQQGGFLAADEGPRPFIDGETDGELRVAVAAQQAALLAAAQGLADAGDGQGVLGADVEYAACRPHRPRGDQHPLDDAVGKRLQDHAIHEGTGVALVAVADHVLKLGGRGGRDPPFGTGGKTRPASAAKSAAFDFVDHGFGRHLVPRAAAGAKAVQPQVFVQVQGIGFAAVLDGDAVLPPQKGTHRRIADVDAMPVRRLSRIAHQGVQPPGDVVSQPPERIAGAKMRVEDPGHVLGVHLGIQLGRAATGDDLHQRRLMAHPHASDPFDRRPRAIDCGQFHQSLVNPAAPLGLAARSQTHADFGLGLLGGDELQVPRRGSVGRPFQKIRDDAGNLVRGQAAVGRLIDLHHGCQRAASQARHCLHGKAPRRIGVFSRPDPQVPRQGVHDQIGALDVARRPAADVNHVLAHGTMPELRVERRHTRQLRGGDAGLRADIFQRLLRQIVEVCLNGLQNGDRRVRASAVAIQNRVDYREIEGIRGMGCYHESDFRGPCADHDSAPGRRSFSDTNQMLLAPNENAAGLEGGTGHTLLAEGAFVLD